MEDHTKLKIFKLYYNEHKSTSPLEDLKIKDRMEYIHDGSGWIYVNFSKLPFTNREEYLGWRSLWKLAYHQLSMAIRCNKTERDMSPHQGRNVWEIQSLLSTQRVIAYKMVQQRIDSKIKAGMLRAKQQKDIPNKI